MGEAAYDRADREYRDPDQKQPLAAVTIAKAATQQHERPEDQRVALDYPLCLECGCMERILHDRKRDGDDAAVDENKTGTEDRRGPDPRAGLGHSSTLHGRAVRRRMPLRPV